jgi:cytochrome c-type biogenesis protein
MGAGETGLVAAFAGGLVSFLSPCILPLVPSYFAYLAGQAVEELGGQGAARREAHRRLLVNAVAFVLGFSVVFILLGLSASAVGRWLLAHRALLEKVGGVVVILLGLHLTGVLNLPALNRYYGHRHLTGNVGPVRSLLAGTAFSVGWSPCIGPILSSILILAGSAASMRAGAVLLTAYSLGLAVPFLASALLLSTALERMRGLSRHLGAVQKLSGLLMILMGVALYTGHFSRLSGAFG